MNQDPPHILLIDDNEHGLIARRAVLEQHGYAVQTAFDGSEGLRLFDEGRFDLVVTDYRMPGLCGRQILDKIREKAPRTPVVVLSGYVGSLGLGEELNDADAVLTKGPSEHEDLVRAISRLIRRKPQRQRSPDSRPKRRTSYNA
jgi:CheY-like chemotaxis protein